MKNERGNISKKVLSLLLAAIIIMSSIACISYAADTFETQISAFPESYKPYLRELHKLYPSWKFEAMQTGLDWTDAVNAENRPNNSLVSSGGANSFKSHEANDYNSSTGVYKQWDSGFVRGNKIAVSHYMDPRNFLNESMIFVFEKLSFDSSFTAADVEGVLKGSFMANKKISYLNASGKTVNTSTTYAQAILNAGKECDINPCFLASKILNEVGSSGSASVSGNNTNYPGIYNFYNVGATDGAGAIERGLKWASTSGSYGRPWNTPQKSITGGAEFLAESYIAKGQFTSYLQRFNVNPNSTNSVYTHQYMTNLSGAASPAYSTYSTYKANNMLSNSFVFSIPVFNNMPAANSTTGTITLADAQSQTGKASYACNVRKGPSVYYDNIGISAQSGTEFEILETVATDTTYPVAVANNPYWSKVTFTSSGKTYTGYVSDELIDLDSYTNVAIGSYTPVEFKTDKALEYRYVSTNEQIATITNDKTINFKKAGMVTIYAYDSLGHFQKVKYKVTSTAPTAAPKPSTTKITENSASITFAKNSKFTSYEVFVTDANNNLISKTQTTSNTVNVSSLKAGTSYKIYARGKASASDGTSFSTLSAPYTFKTNGDLKVVPAVTGLKAVNNNYNSVVLTWNKALDVDGYVVYKYDASSKTYKNLVSVKGVTTYTDKSENAVNETTYYVKAYRIIDGKTYFSASYGQAAVYKPNITPKATTGIKQTSGKTDSVTISWTADKNASGYLVYVYNDKTKKYERKVKTTSTKATIASLSPGKTYKIKIRSYFQAYSKTFYGTYSNIYSAITAPSKVSGLKLSSVTDSSYKISWKAVSGADGYAVYRYDANTKKYVRIATVKTNSYTVKSLASAKANNYQVRAYKKTSAITCYGSYSSTLPATTAPKKPSGLKASSVTKNSVKLSWKKTSGATQYEVYKYNTSSKKYTLLGKTSGTSLTVKKLNAKTKYQFCIKAVKTYKTATGKSAYSSKITVTTKK